MNDVPSKVAEYFKQRGSKSRSIWPFALHANDGQGWRQIGWIRRKMQMQHGSTVAGKAWPLSTTAVQFTDGEHYVDFGRNELVGSGVAA